MTATVPVFRPQLPDATRLLPYLRRIDATRLYANWGPLATELEVSLAKHLQLPPHAVVSASSGTAALVGAVLAIGGRARPDRPLAIAPAYTFVATAIALEHCGYQPYAADIDPASWQLDLRRLAAGPSINRAGLVVVVAPFGRPVDQEVCRAFRARTGIPVVIDGGASFEAVSTNPGRYLGEAPVALSFHATKSFATGEGGSVVTTDRELAASVTRALNFGFHESRNSASASTNGKMSEYHAAVGLAELDTWSEKCRALRNVADRYRRRLGAAGLADRFFGTPVVAGCYALFAAKDPAEAARLEEQLTSAAIEFRLWYGNGLLDQRYFRNLPHDPLPVTERLAPCLVGLPVATDLSDDVIDRVADAIEATVV